ncbi:tryptophan synthase beta subunit-like PLP-dependent enzyme [Pseudovirgaria hyperparasitica]|uniref:Tryptophan synthase beta subunit-like PLP-dependent enzyme n=1 Tax=Pseudovirgaria hyperparasitica TaxID=470096 RepID=A0A6A6VV04_9PEZI|nr:tryptophan synthase beta subunit-like PLP-dependent enzyme [Pseudovirgaria hyperparasitica]KAF2753616.1 tryptophan synthase beta subunit-like PLP-dependent enzyme [Pseudovirgaria hyperparasitica]
MDSFLYTNSVAASWTCPAVSNDIVHSFHRSLPDYSETRLHSLPDLATDLGVAHVVIKDESTRFGLPAFKITGASWAVYRAVCEATSLPLNVSLEVLGRAANDRGIRMVACTEGNWGQAVAQMARYLSIPATIFVPRFMSTATQATIEGEGAQVIKIEGDYDESVKRAEREAKENDALLCMDTAWPGYEKIPAWVVQGYATILSETDAQLEQLVGRPATHAFAPVGVGSWGHAVTVHYKSKTEGQRALVVAVEPDTAACLKTSLKKGMITSIETGESIMAGMNCGTVSLMAWPALRDGADAVVTVTDVEAHRAVEYLHSRQVIAGPCGASTVAAFRKISNQLGLGRESVVVLFSTEGSREYKIPE